MRTGLTRLAGAEGDVVRARVEVQLHRDADDDMTAAGAGLVDPDGRAAVDTAGREGDDGLAHPCDQRRCSKWCAPDGRVPPG